MSLSRRVRPPRVLVIYKKSAYQLYVRERKHRHVERLIAQGDPSVSRLMRAHQDHVATVKQAKASLRRLGARAIFRYRRELAKVEDCDLVLTLGGDGTLLWASHAVGPNVPMLAINTAPVDSVGFLCSGSKVSLEETIELALGGELQPTELSRMRLSIDGEVVSERILNDVLYCHACPAATSRYILTFGNVEEEQKSSGLWVGPAAGSTAAQRSAGGRVLALESRELQFVVREPYEPTGRPYALAQGVIEPSAQLDVLSKMRGARVFLDGPHQFHDLDIGARLSMRLSNEPLTVLGLERSRRHQGTWGT